MGVRITHLHLRVPRSNRMRLHEEWAVESSHAGPHREETRTDRDIDQSDRPGQPGRENGKVFLIGGSATEPSSIVRIDLSSRETEVLHRSREITVGKEYISIPNAIEFPTENERTAFAFFYPPKSPEYEAPQSEKPPLLVVSHGGPT